MDNVHKYPQLLKQIIACRVAGVIEKNLQGSAGPEMLVQVEANGRNSATSSPSCYWFASIVSIKGFNLALRFIGDTHNETILNMKLYSPRLHAVGWSKETAASLRPPKHLLKRLGSSAASAALDQRLQQPYVTLPSYFSAINSPANSSRSAHKN